MKSWLVIPSLLLPILLLNGCLFYQAPVMPPAGLLFTSISAPIDTDMEDSKPTGNVGSASSMSILALVAFGEATVSKAAENGRLEKVDNVEYEYFSVLLGLYQQFTIKAYGE